MTYHLSRNGQPTGTCSKEDAIARYARGEILPTDLVWCEGMANWTPASQVFGAATPPPAPAAAPSTATPPPAPQALPRPVMGDLGKPANNLVWAILTTLFCCLPAGVVAIVYAAQVDSKWTAGDRAGAESAAKNARMWSLISAGIGLVGGLAYAAFMIFAAAAASSAGAY
ncbi:MAG: CD225/dispanin family protein [Opitutaceae bacterium]|nr:CD225/dispanin family protein [Opitutaceae bacterium]